jgi:hypothetical protein
MPTAPLTYLRALDTGVSKINEDKLFDVKSYIIFGCFKSRCVLSFKRCKRLGLHNDLIEIIIIVFLMFSQKKMQSRFKSSMRFES